MYYFILPITNMPSPPSQNYPVAPLGISLAYLFPHSLPGSSYTCYISIYVFWTTCLSTGCSVNTVVFAINCNPFIRLIILQAIFKVLNVIKGLQSLLLAASVFWTTNSSQVLANKRCQSFEREPGK